MALETTSGLLWPGAGPFGGERLSAIDVLALAGENPDAIREGVRVAFADCDLSGAVAEEAHEGPSGSRLPCAVPRSRSRGVAAPQGNAHPGAQHHRPAAGALREQGASP
jgi:hypothetical protein